MSGAIVNFASSTDAYGGLVLARQYAWASIALIGRGDFGLSYYQPKLFNSLHFLELLIKAWADYSSIERKNTHADVSRLMILLEDAFVSEKSFNLNTMREYIDFVSQEECGQAQYDYPPQEKVYTKIRYQELTRFSGSSLSCLLRECLVVLNWIEEKYEPEDRWVIREIPQIWPEAIPYLEFKGISFKK